MHTATIQERSHQVDLMADPQTTLPLGRREDETRTEERIPRPD